jgi:hypothetical protein
MPSNNNTSSDQVNSETVIQTGPKPEFFSWLPNCVVYEWGLSVGALAVALYLNGKPSGWQTRPFDIQQHFKLKEKAWYKISKELKKVGLLHERATNKGKALWFELPEMNLVINKKPTGHFGKLQKRNPAKTPVIANKEFLPEKDVLSEKETLCISENENKKMTKDELQIIFDKLWDIYPLKKAKQKAKESIFKIFKGKTKVEAENLAIKIWEGLNACVTEHTVKNELKNQGGDLWIPNLPHLTTWLNQSRWEDSYMAANDILNSTERKKHGLDLDIYQSGWV